MRFMIVAGVLLYLGLLAMAGLGVQTNAQMHANAGRYHGFWSDWGLLLTLIAASPAVLLAAVAAWRRHRPRKDTTQC